jgi:dTDP-4-amino-4,6-dideoxygalactose transaminase
MHAKVPYLDLPAQIRPLRAEIDTAIARNIDACSFCLGPDVAQFEKDFAKFCGAEHCVAFNSGTSALHVALLLLDIKQDDEIISTPHTFVATSWAISYVNARPVYVDIDDATFNLDPKLIEQAITPRTKAVMPVHLHGRLAHMTAITAVAREHGLLVIEDAAQAHGAQRGRRAGALGDIGCFSFYPGKNLGACCEGGAITTDRADFAETIRSLRDWGQQGKYNHVRHGFNYRMDGIQGAALGVKLPRLKDWNAARRRIANAYQRGLSPTIGRPSDPIDTAHACHVYAIRVAERDAVRAKLEQAGIATSIHYPVPVHLQPA